MKKQPATDIYMYARLHIGEEEFRDSRLIFVLQK